MGVDCSLLSSLGAQAGILKTRSVKTQLALADVFAESSDNERTFYGFSDSEFSDHREQSNLDDKDESQPELSPKKETTTSKSSSGAYAFRLRVALRSTPSTQQSTDDDDDDDGHDEKEAEEKRTMKRGLKRTGNTSRAKRTRRIKFEGEDEETVAQLSPAEERGSDSAEDVADSFLAKRQQNIKANKAMLAQLMADLQKMPGGAGILKKQAGKQKRSSRPPRSGAESRKNPERASRRLTRSMGGGEEASAPKEEELELSLEELLEVRRAPQRRGAPRPNQSKPHFIRPVDDITEDELRLVAENMTDKVYNRVTGSTCHQCRQKTVDTKTCCRSEDCRGIQGQFCGPCLRNRYGEDVKKALLDPEWKCPPCRGICNCSFCRQRDGRCPTGILFPLAQYHGFSDVHSYLSSLRNKLKSEDDVEM
uniref:cell division cycle-associated protein 7-like n=1 Tax=Semicossyphus pulcher TaxID=241346 RepID=UPI0037E748C0